MSMDQRLAIEREVAGFFRRGSSGYGSRPDAAVIGLCVQAMSRRGQAELERNVAREALAAAEKELDECKDNYDHVVEYLAEYVLPDGEPGPVAAAQMEEIDTLRSQNRLLTSQFDSAQYRIRHLEEEVASFKERLAAVFSGDRRHGHLGRPDPITQENCDAMKEKIGRMEEELGAERRARREAERINLNHEMERSTMQGIIDELQLRPVLNYQPPSHLDLSDPKVMRQELDRLTHNDSVSLYAKEFYERRHDLAEERLKQLKEAVDCNRLCHRMDLKKKEEEIMALRRRIEGLVSEEERSRWTRFEREGYLGLPVRAPTNMQERHSSPPIVVLTRNVDIESVYFKILDPIPHQVC
ncbi:hypothetical protein CF327_g4424 [Tilletia walkeri]|nr:hypothetical protein CF327_g4424 [Tilletia walkeri]